MARAKAAEDHLEELEQIGKGLQRRRTPAKSQKSSTEKKLSNKDLKDAYERHLAGAPGYETQRDVVKTLGTSKGTVYRAFKEFSSFHVEASDEEPHTLIEDGDLGKLEEDAKQAIAFEAAFNPGVQNLRAAELDNERYQPRAMIAAGDDLINDILLRGGNIYPVLIQSSRMAVVDGHRRVDAIQRLNRDNHDILVKCDVQDLTDEEAALLAYQVNVLSSPLSEGERDKWIFRLMSEFNYTTKDLQIKTGLAESTLLNIQRAFTKTTDAVKERLQSGAISTGVAKALASLSAQQQTRLVKKAEEKKLSVRDVESEARELRGRDSARAKLVKHFEEKGLAGTTLELEPSQLNFRDPKRDWADSIIKEVYGSSWERVEGHLVDYSDIIQAAKHANLTIEVNKAAIPLCEVCLWNSRKKCAQKVEGYPKLKECNRQVPLDRKSRWQAATCSICGEINIGLVEELDYEGNHKICQMKRVVGIDSLTGLCESCGEPCQVVSSIYAHGDEKIRTVHVSQCTEYEKAPELQDLVAKSNQFAEEMIAAVLEGKNNVKLRHEAENGGVA